MIGPFAVAREQRVKGLRAASFAAICFFLAFDPVVYAQTDADLELETLAHERELLTRELEQYKGTVELLELGDTPPEQSGNAAVRKLALEMVRIKERLIKVTERELTLLQQQITNARLLSMSQPEIAEEEAAEEAIESKPIRLAARNYSMESEREHVARLHALLVQYYAELQEAAQTLPSDQELAARAAASIEATTLAPIPYSADKIRLSGAEGSTALSRITQRLIDPTIPESRRDVEQICSIRTQLLGELIASERRSLKPVGKNNYVARIQLKPGSTTLRIKDHRWEVHIPEQQDAADFLITLYLPPQGIPELHLFSVEELLAEKNAHIPAWLPEELNINPSAG
ncbi:MAG: hypothetical protein AAGF35_08440 [Pseudomonadota bacterium]